MYTIATKKYPLNKEQFDKILLEHLLPYSTEYRLKLKKLLTEMNYIYKNQTHINSVDNKFHFDLGQKVAFSSSGWKSGYTGPKETFHADQRIECQLDTVKASELNRGILLEYIEDVGRKTGYPVEIPTLIQLKRQWDFLTDFFDRDMCLACINESINSISEVTVYEPGTNTIYSANMVGDKEIFILPIVNLKVSNYIDLLMKYLVPWHAVPEGLSDEAQELFQDLCMIYDLDEKCVFYNELESKIYVADEKMLKQFIKDPENDKLKSLHWEVTKFLEEYYRTKCIGEQQYMDTKEKLLQCEKRRADIEPYEECILTDVNRGHWDLWKDETSQGYTVELENEYIARNPVCDINENGVIAIDFGTKSTVVVYQSDMEHSLPMGIGDGNLSKKLDEDSIKKRYENPTVMHFVNLEEFLEDYRARAGRPDTKWNDLTISHTAMDQFSTSQSAEYYEYLHQIKQWAGQRERQFRIQPHVGKSIVLPAFLDLKENDINPIEIYAYYIGLYINNMRKGHGIFLDYYLSFPVTYEMKIREKIVESFEKGLKKSLPESILNNPEIMKRFHVNGDISEPAAYAACALQEYGFEPEEGEEIFYGIFDFGGGTTDFDFGLWKQSKKRRYDYTIENFGAGGDEFLGGENLLEMLAFEVFKKNQNLMREKGYTFKLAPKCNEFIGSDALLADSQEAEKNMHNLMEVLRPYWEQNDDSSDIDNESDTYSEENSKWFNNYIKLILKECEKNGIGGNSAAISSIELILKKIEGKVENNTISIDKAFEQIENFLKSYQIDIHDINIPDNQVFVSDKNETDIDIEFKVDLYNKNGEDTLNESLKFSKKELYQFIEDKIREGVKNFFTSLMLSYQNDKVKKPSTVNILLAGNSCKSPVVKRIFEEEINKRQNEIKTKYHIEGNVEKMFDVFPPLGTKEAYEKMKERGLKPDEGNPEKPTGKTGVAFGLIQLREGGVIERVINVGIEDEVPFQYFIGWMSRKKFVPFKDDSHITKYKGKPDYNTWYKFIEADSSAFELYYTTLPECVEGNLEVNGNAAVKRIRCNLDVVDEEAFVYIRAVNPHTLEYVVAKDEKNIEGTKIGEIIRKELK